MRNEAMTTFVKRSLGITVLDAARQRIAGSSKRLLSCMLFCLVVYITIS